MPYNKCDKCDKCDKSSTGRFIHNVINAPAVTIYIDDRPIVYNLAYKDVTEYLALKSGHRQLKVLISGTDTVLISKKIVIDVGQDYTMIVLGSVKDLATLNVYVYVDNLTCPHPGNAHLRFIHGVYGAPAVDVYANDKLIFADVKYTQTGTPTYAPIRVGTVSVPGQDPNYVNVAVKVAGTNTTVVGPVPLYLISGGIYTLVASGSLEQGLSAVFSHDNPDSCEKLMQDFRVQAYMGKWYQIASIPQFYEIGCVRQTAEYTFLSDRINVFNTCFNNQWEPIRNITGSAVALNPCNPAALRVTFPNPPPPAPPLPVSPPGPNYLIHKTDYVNYAIIGSPARTSFYILAREAQMCESLYKKCLAFAKKLGYDIDKIKLNYNAVNYKC